MDEQPNEENLMLYLTDVAPTGVPHFHRYSTSSDWDKWLSEIIPNNAHDVVRRRMCSNLKHIIVGLEMKAGLILAHHQHRALGSVLFEPYFQILTFEFCVGVFSVCEGLGSIIHLTNGGNDGRNGGRVYRKDWINTLVGHFGQGQGSALRHDVTKVTRVRDRMHQDRLGARQKIDWHYMGYKEAFVPARSAMQNLFLEHPEKVPRSSNLLRRNS